MGLKSPQPGSKFKGSDHYYVLLCDCSAYGDKDMLICGVFASYKEAREVQRDVKDCPAKHWIKKCSVVVTLA